MLEKINLYVGKIIYNEFCIDLTRSAYDQIENLQEDLLLIEYRDRYLLDISWFRMGKPEGFFLIRVIEDHDWDKPLFKIKVKKFEVFIESLQKAIDFLVMYKSENPNKPYRESWYDFKNFSDGKSD